MERVRKEGIVMPLTEIIYKRLKYPGGWEIALFSLNPLVLFSSDG
jgi:hypothetical protein